MANTSVQLTQNALEKLEILGESSAAYNALISAAKKSSYLTELLNVFGATKAEFRLGGNGGGTGYDGNEITIDPTWIPGSGSSSAETPGIFATTITHELGHAVIAGGYGYIGEITNPLDAARSGLANEGVALTAEYIVAKQLGTNMHSDPSGTAIMPKLDAIAQSTNTDVQTLALGCDFNSTASESVVAGGAFYDTRSPSIAPNLKYGEYFADWYIIDQCNNTNSDNKIPVLDVDWSQMLSQDLHVQYDSNGNCSYSLPVIPLKNGDQASITGVLNDSGTPISMKTYDYSSDGSYTSTLQTFDSSGTELDSQIASADALKNITEVQNFSNGKLTTNAVIEGIATDEQLASEYELSLKLVGVDTLSDMGNDSIGQDIFDTLGITQDIDLKTAVDMADDTYSGSNIESTKTFASKSSYVSWLEEQYDEASSYGQGTFANKEQSRTAA